MAARKKPVEVEDDGETPREPGVTLPPIDDFIRKLSDRFTNEVVIPDSVEEESEEV